MSNVMQPLPKDDPRVVAFDAYKASDDYQNIRKWAQYDQHVDGSLWAAFIKGCETQPPHPTLTESRLLQILSDKFKDAWTDRDRQAFIDMLRAAGVEVKQ